MKLRNLFAVTFTCSVFSFPVLAQDHAAHAGSNRGPLKKIMTDLGEAMNHLNDGIFKEDFEAIAKAADEVAAHPQVLPEEMEKISKALGKEMAKFKKWDHLAHESAGEASKAAKAGKIAEVVKFQGKALDACVSCHTEFRKRFSYLWE